MIRDFEKIRPYALLSLAMIETAAADYRKTNEHNKRNVEYWLNGGDAGIPFDYCMYFIDLVANVDSEIVKKVILSKNKKPMIAIGSRVRKSMLISQKGTNTIKAAA